MKALRIILASIKRADQEFNLINDKDKIVVGVSGGKDSMLLLYALKLYKTYSKKNFEIYPCIIDLGFPNFSANEVSSFINKLGMDIKILDGKTVYPILQKQQINQKTPHLPCSICSKMKKAIINKYAKSINANKVTFAHHQDDAIETLFLNMIYGGRLATFSPKMLLSNENIVFIRPLIYVKENIIKRCIKEENIVYVPSNCPNDGITKRKEIKDYLELIYKNFKESKDNLLNILINREKESLFYSSYQIQIGNNLYYKEIYSIEDYQKYEKYINKQDNKSIKRDKKSYQNLKYYLIYKKEKIVGAISLKIENKDFSIVSYKFNDENIMKKFIFVFYKKLYMKNNPLKLYIKLNHEFLKEIGFTYDFNEKAYVLSRNIVDIEKQLKIAN